MPIEGEHDYLLEADIRRHVGNFRLEVQLQMGRGCLGILGPSGCGKSMTLKSIAGIIHPDCGRIRLNGRMLYDSEKKVDLPPRKRRTGYLFQNYALFPNMTVEQNILIGIQYGMSASGGRAGRRSGEKPSGAKQVKALLSRFQLEGLEKQYPRQLSGGQQQRVALARIFAYEPDVLLLDEPFSALDTYLREGLRLQMEQVLDAYEGISVLVTHDRDEAYQLCSHLLLMSGGKVLRAGETGEVFADPGTVQAARLTGCKNISRIRRLDSHRICALDWQNLELVTANEVGEDITAVGIRAHDFEPLGSTEAESFKNRPGGNLIPAKNPSIAEMPFEWYITFENGIWWKTGKNIHTHDCSGILPEWLRVEPEAILLLRED